MQPGDTPSSRREFPPLLPEGFHPMTVADLRALCVDGFPTSVRRRAIMDGLEAVIAELRRHHLEGELWVDGSFLTEKIDPEDVDMSFVVHMIAGGWLTLEQSNCLKWFERDIQASHRCDGYMFLRYPPGHPRHDYGERQAQKWQSWWSTARDGTRKGIAVLRLP